MAKSCGGVPKLTNIRYGADPSVERLFGKPGSPPAYQTSTKAPPIPLQLESSTLIFYGNFPYFFTFFTSPVLSVELPGYDRWARCAGPVHSFLGRLAVHNFFCELIKNSQTSKNGPSTSFVVNSPHRDWPDDCEGRRRSKIENMVTLQYFLQCVMYSIGNISPFQCPRKFLSRKVFFTVLFV